MQHHAQSCQKDKLIYPENNYYGLEPGDYINLPGGRISCDSSFGEDYVYRACLNRCPDSPCPLQTSPRYEHCPAQFPHRIGTLANRQYLTFFVGSRLNELNNSFFVCKDGRRCFEYSQVCDLQVDCNDGSDEAMCTNSFKCSSGQPSAYLPIARKCDRHFDCGDLSDECKLQSMD